VSSGESSGGGEKSHEPTEKKVHDARKKGDIARSPDISAAATYFGLAISIAVFGRGVVNSAGSILSGVYGSADTFSVQLFASGGRSLMLEFLLDLGLAIAPIFLFPVAVLFAVMLAQRAIVFAPTKLELKLSRISLLASLKNKFGPSGLVEFAKNFLKLVVVSVGVIWFLKGHFGLLVGSVQSEANIVAYQMARMLISFLWLVFLISLVVGAGDYFWQVFDHKRKLMMTRQEVMDEHKDSEGDPHMKQKRRQRGYDIATQRMMADVPGADVIMVNPQHFAVALKWDRSGNGAPVCVAKGVDEIAARIREIATESGVPIHRDPPTTRAIYATVDIGEEIQTDHYKAVAAAIRYAEKIKNMAG